VLVYKEVSMRVTAHARTALALALALALTATTGMLTAFPAFGVTPDHEEKICGTVTLPGPYAQDAEVSAVAFQNLGGTWTAVAGEAVNEDGTYCVVLPEPGTYRIGFFDAALVYADTYYLNASSVSVATDIVVSDGSTVNGINQTLTQNPVNVIQGRVNFVGAPGTRVGVEVYRQETIEGELLWTTVHTRMTAEDGTYRIHTPGAGTYRIGFIDFDDIFGHVFYTNAGSVEDAHDVVVTAGTPVSGIDVTMTAQPSTRIFGPNRFATAAAISQRTFEDGFGGTVVLVSGQSAPDGLSSAVLAYALEGPTLLTTNSYIPDVTMEEIRRLSPGEVVIVGGTGVVSLSQEFALRRAGVPIVRRLAGSDRYGTAVEVAREIANRGLYGGGELDVFVANGN
jgi:hypothetical protein